MTFECETCQFKYPLSCRLTFKVVILCSAADVLLGMLPLARQLLRRGTAVVIAANSLPSINDITAAELDALLPQVGAVQGQCVQQRSLAV